MTLNRTSKLIFISGHPGSASVQPDPLGTVQAQVRDPAAALVPEPGRTGHRHHQPHPHQTGAGVYSLHEINIFPHPNAKNDIL